MALGMGVLLVVVALVFMAGFMAAWEDRDERSREDPPDEG